MTPSINELSSQKQLTDKLTIQALSFKNIWLKIYALLNDFFQTLPVIMVALVVIIIFYIIGAICRHVIKKIMINNRHYNVALVFARIAHWTLILAGILISLAIIFPSITPVDLLAGLGVGSIVLGFAFKDILQNYVTGLLILLKEPFKIGDEIRYREYEGRVEFIDTRTTFLKSYDGRRILIPNGEIYTNAIIINTAYGNRCTEYDLNIGNSDSLQKASEIILKVLRNIDTVMKHPEPEVFVIALDTTTNNLRARWWTTPYQIEVLRIRSTVLKQIKQELYNAGIDIPFPTQVILWHDQTEETDGDRNKQREGWPPGRNPPKSRSIAASIHNLEQPNSKT